MCISMLYVGRVTVMDLYEKQFNANRDSSTAWHNKSANLLTTAHVLWKAMEDDNSLSLDCWSTYKMLMGMSFELLFKSICIQKNLTFKHTHNLVSLSKSAGINLSKDEASVLSVLTEYIYWDGKYPTPKDKDALEKHWKNENKVTNHETKMGNLTIQEQNGKLDFDQLIKIWRDYSDAYMDNKKPSV